MELFDQLFNSSNIYDLFMKNPEAIRNLNLADKEMQEILNRTEKYINDNGTEAEKEALILFKKFINEKEGDNIKNIEKNILELKDKLNEKYNNKTFKFY